MVTPGRGVANLDDEYDILEYDDRTSAQVDADVVAEAVVAVQKAAEIHRGRAGVGASGAVRASDADPAGEGMTVPRSVRADSTMAM
ncbi:hypothetical protein RKD29_000087 [Streptomyces tendae]|uniref:hypothetical protein n=1 Tax=Streptomyces tendae TaxID=1932 RepID=UPI003835313B